MSNTRKVVSITTNLGRYGGAQKVLMDVHNGLKRKYSCVVTGRQDFKELHPKYKIEKTEYVKFNLSILRNNIVIVHARNVIPFIVFLNKVFFLNAKIIYVSHNVYSTYKNLTFFPKDIVSISTKVTDNLLNYFKVRKKRISLIYNGISDTYKQEKDSRRFKEDGIVKILYPARVNNVKRQIDLVKNLEGKLDNNIKIYFAGVGEDFEELKVLCKDKSNFIAMGFVEDMESLILECDFLMLYSIQEGLPIALLEGIMNRKPLLVNDVGGNLEIGVPKYNGIELVDNFSELFLQLNDLNEMAIAEYNRLATNSRILFLEKFVYEDMVEGYSQLISSI